nr:phage tail tape measure protein [Bacillus sp. 03113]
MAGLDISYRITAIDNFSDTMRNLDRQTRRAFDSIGDIGKAVSIAGIALGGALGLAAKSAMDFEQQMSNVKAVSGASGDEMKQLTALAKELGAETKYSSKEAAQGIEELIKAGVSTADIMNGGLKGALSLATAGELELADAAEIASTALNAFKADNLTVVDAANLLAGAANASATDVSELKFGLSMVSAVASGVGLSFKDTTTALATFAQNGLKGSDAGTSLKTMLLNLSPSTDGAATQMEKLGLLTADGTSKFYDANGSIKSLAEIAELLKTQLAGLTDEQRQLALKTMFGTDAIRAANILYKEGAAGVSNMYSAMSKVTAADVAAEKMNNVKGRIEQLKGAVETMAISLGNALLPAISKIVAGLQWLVDKFNGLSPAMQSFIAITAVVVAVLALIAGPILILIAMLPSLMMGFTAIAGAVGMTAGALAGLLGIIAGVVAALALIGVGLYIAYQKVDWFRNAVDAAWAWIKSAWQNALTFISGIVQSIMGAVSAFIGGKLAEIKSFWAENGAQIMSLAKTNFGIVVAVIKGAMDAIKGVFQIVWPLIVAVVKVAWALIQSVIGTFITAILGIIRATMRLMQGDWQGAWNAIKDTAKTIWQNIVGYFKGIDLRQIGKDIINGLINGISSMAGGVARIVKKIADSIPDGVKKFLGIHSPSRVLMELGGYAGEGFQIGLSDQLSQIKSASRDLAYAAVPNVQPPSTQGYASSVPAQQTTQANTKPVYITNVVTLDGYEIARTTSPYIDAMQTDRVNLNTFMKGDKR